MSKYDLDRANLNLQRANAEKGKRRSVNARVKKDVIETAERQTKFSQVKQKINKIRTVSQQKAQSIELRRQTAIEN